MTAEEKRLAALLDYEIMDTPPEQAFDDLTYLTSFICGMPMAMVTLLDTRRQWFKSKVGTQDSETPIEHAFCAHAIKQEKVFLVPDAQLDVRFSSNRLVTGAPHIRFYAGAPLMTPDGVAVGTLCALDRVPRKLSEEQQMALEALSRQVIAAMEMRKTMKALKNALAEKKKAEREVGALQELLPVCAMCRKVRDDERYWHHVEDYIAQRNNLRVCHGVCPECAAGLEREARGE